MTVSTITEAMADTNNNCLTPVDPKSSSKLDAASQASKVQAWQRLKRLSVFILDMANVDRQEFRSMALHSKLLTLIKVIIVAPESLALTLTDWQAPIYILFTLTIPMFDLDMPMSGWHQGLYLTQLVISPHICMLLTRGTFVQSGVPNGSFVPFSPVSFSSPLVYHGTALAISAFLVPILYLTSSKRSPPVYHPVYAFLGYVPKRVNVYVFPIVLLPVSAYPSS